MPPGFHLLMARRSGCGAGKAVRSPDRATRLSDPPDVDLADAASIADWIEDQRSLLPLFAIVSAAVGAFLAGGLLVGALPRPEPSATDSKACPKQSTPSGSRRSCT